LRSPLPFFLYQAVRCLFFVRSEDDERAAARGDADLALRGKKPFIVEMPDNIIKVKGVSAANSNCLRDLIRYHEIPVYLETGALEIKDNSLVVETGGQKRELPADSVIVSIGYTAGNPFITKKQKHIHVLGDADHVANLKDAIWAANDLAIRLSK